MEREISQTRETWRGLKKSGPADKERREKICVVGQQKEKTQLVEQAQGGYELYVVGTFNRRRVVSAKKVRKREWVGGKKKSQGDRKREASGARKYYSEQSR